MPCRSSRVRSSSRSALRIDLGKLPGLNVVPPVPKDETLAIWADRVSMILKDDALPVLRGLELCLPEKADPLAYYGPGRSPDEQRRLYGFLQERIEAREPITFNALRWEDQGGRRYPTFIPGYKRALPISRNSYSKATTKYLLSAIPREVRAMLKMPEGWSTNPLCGDFKCCHMAIALALSGDKRLADDLKGDVHQQAGDHVLRKLEWAGGLSVDQRRTFGKLLNLKMLFGTTASGVQQAASGVLGRDLGEREAQEIAWAWWDRYRALSRFRERVFKRIKEARSRGVGLVVVSPSGKRSRFSPAEVKGEPMKGESQGKGIKGAQRSIFSAIPRAVEGDLLDLTLRYWHQGRDAHDGRLVLPIYDGIYFAARDGREHETWTAMENAAARAAKEIGVRTKFVRE